MQVAAVAFVVFPFLTQALRILGANWTWLYQQLPDDAFYYLVIARNFAGGDGFSFDRINETNGFHPLWQALLIPLARVFPGDVGYARAVLVLGLVMLLAAALITVHVVRGWLGFWPAILGGAAVGYGTTAFTWTVNGMEGAVVVLTLTLTMWGLARFDRERTAWSAALVGLACCGVVLARFDMAAVVWIVPVAMLVRTRRWSLLGWWAVGIAALGLPLGIWWLARWGHLLTVSASVKRVGLGRSMEQRYGGRLTGGYLSYLWDVATHTGSDAYSGALPRARSTVVRGVTGVLVIVLSFAGAVLGVLGLRRHLESDEPRLASPQGWAVVVALVVVGAKTAFDVVNVPPWAATWYSAPVRFALAGIIGVLVWNALAALAERARWAAFTAGGLLGVLVVAGSLSGTLSTDQQARTDGRWWDEVDRAADWIVAEGPTGRFGARDAGILGYRLGSERSVVNLDGLVNDYDFGEIVKADASLLERIRYADVEFFVGRLQEHELPDLPCASVLWTSPHVVSYESPLRDTSRSDGYVYVLDTRGCLADDYSLNPGSSDPSGTNA